MAICEVCGIDYPSKRADSKTCSPSCRKTASRLSVTSEVPVSVTNAKCDKPTSDRPGGTTIPGDVGYDGVGLQEKYRDHWAHPEGVDFRPDDEPIETDIQAPDPLPACVPDIIRDKYNREGAEYRATIDRLVSTSIADLLAAGVYMPVWRYQLDSMLTTSSPPPA